MSRRITFRQGKPLTALEWKGRKNLLESWQTYAFKLEGNIANLLPS
jgi:hypothetical protein